MKVVCISDVHGQFSRFPVEGLPEGGLCLIAGDLTNVGIHRPSEMFFANYWLKELEQKYPLVAHIKGNHDLGVMADGFYTSDTVRNVQDSSWLIRSAEKGGAKSWTIRGANLSVCYNMPALAQRWTNMTDNPEVEQAYYGALKPCDILVSHSPPSGVLALNTDGQDCGSTALRRYIETHQPKLVVCGHIHEAAGQEQIGETLVVNTAMKVTVAELA